MLRKLGMLSMLYVVQGLPYGFQATALPVYLREQGMSLTGIGLASALSYVWAIKLLWGPPVDCYGSRRFGRRKSWIVPLQALLALCCLATVFMLPSGSLMLLLTMVLLMSLCTSTMDVAVDGLAVDLLRREELGYGNIAQVVGFKLGILTGGGLLVWATKSIGWQGLFVAMATLVAAAFVVTLLFREPAPQDPAPRPTFGALLASLRRALTLPGTGWLLVFVATYKIGESMADAMFRPFLFDAGFTADQIGLWIGTWGMLFSLSGSFLGGVLASRLPILTAVGLAALLSAGAVAAELWLSTVTPTVAKAAAVIAGENFFGGMLTTAMFAYMMSRVDRRIGATHYTLLATIEVFPKVAAAQVSGVLAEHFGYTALFALATVLAFAFLTLLVPLRRAERSRPASG